MFSLFRFLALLSLAVLSALWVVLDWITGRHQVADHKSALSMCWLASSAVALYWLSVKGWPGRPTRKSRAFNISHDDDVVEQITPPRRVPKRSVPMPEPSPAAEPISEPQAAANEPAAAPVFRMTPRAGRGRRAS